MISLQAGDGVGYASHFLKAVAVDPKDHELPGMLALFLYDLGIVEVADEFRRRVLALSPTSTVAYQLEMARAKALGDTEASIAAARRAVEDDIENRRYAFGSAVQHLIRTALEQGRVEEELAWLDERYPGMFDVDATQLTLKLRSTQSLAFDAWVNTLPNDEVQRRLDTLLSYVESIGVDPTENPNTRIGVLLIRGHIDEAIELALESVFSESVAMNLNWRETWLQPHYAKVVQDDRIQSAMQRWEDEESALRGSVESYFADMHASR